MFSNILAFVVSRKGYRFVFDKVGHKSYYPNTPVQYTAIFNGCKKYNFQMKNYDILLIFAQNIDRGYMLEPPH